MDKTHVASKCACCSRAALEEVAKAGHHGPTGVGWVVVEGVGAIPLIDHEGTAVRRECMNQIARVVADFNAQREGRSKVVFWVQPILESGWAHFHIKRMGSMSMTAPDYRSLRSKLKPVIDKEWISDAYTAFEARTRQMRQDEDAADADARISMM